MMKIIGVKTRKRRRIRRVRRGVVGRRVRERGRVR